MAEFFERFVLETLDDFLFGNQRIIERLGLEKQINFWMYKLEDAILNPLMKYLYDIEYIGVSNIPADKGAVVCSLFNSPLDPLVLGLTMMRINPPRRLYWTVPVDYLKVPILNWWIRSHFGIPVRTNGEDPPAYAKVKELVGSGELVAILTEEQEDERKTLAPYVFAAGVIYETEAPMIPIAISGTEKIMKKGARFPETKGKIRIKVGTPVRPSELMDEKGDPRDKRFFTGAALKILKTIENMKKELDSEII